MKLRRVYITLLLGAVILGGTLSFLTGATKRGAGQQETDRFEIKNETSSLKLASLSREPFGDEILVNLTLVNASGKAVVAYSLLKQDTTSVTTDGATTGWILAPQASDQVRVLLPASDSKLTIRAVIFGDGSGEGNPRRIRELLDYQMGVRSQYERALPILRRLQNTTHSADRLARVNDLLNLPDKTAELQASIDKLEGAKHAKQFILGQLNLSAESSRVLKEPSASKVNDAVETLEKAMTRLAASTKGQGL